MGEPLSWLLVLKRLGLQKWSSGARCEWKVEAPDPMIKKIVQSQTICMPRRVLELPLL